MRYDETPVKSTCLSRDKNIQSHDTSGVGMTLRLSTTDEVGVTFIHFEGAKTCLTFCAML